MPDIPVTQCGDYNGGEARILINKRSYTQGWILVGWSALAVAIMVAALFAAYGSGEEAARVTIRATARTSFVLFLSAFLASSLYALRQSTPTRWLIRNRRYLGVSFAASHTVHAIAIAWLASITAGSSIKTTETSELVAGSLGYVFIFAMVATSFDRTAAWLGKRSWSVLHKVGIYYLWIIFMFSYGTRALYSTEYAPAAVVLLSAIGLRFIASRTPRKLAATKNA